MKKRLLIFNVLRFVAGVILFAIFYFLFKKREVPYTPILTVIVVFLLLPRYKIIKTQSKNAIQVNWIFFKKILTA